MNLEYSVRILKFKFEAGTSRGVLKEHPVCLLKVFDGKSSAYGLGEAAPLINLSIDTIEEVVEFLPALAAELVNAERPTTEEQAYSLAARLVPESLPSLRFGLEVALLDLMHGGERMVFDNDFYQGTLGIPINGLIWMGDVAFMRQQMDEKVQAGFKCIKMKIGAIDFEAELELLKYLRAKSKSLIIRADANGGFKNNEAFAKLTKLAGLDIHSCEQPIMPQQHEAMQLICDRSEVPIALDEELIGVTEMARKRALVQMIRPQFLVLKPTLLGGIRHTMEWIEIAEQHGIGWWLTSALESAVGLNAIAQLAAQFPEMGYQGLGTGQLYENNILSPLEVSGSFLSYNTGKSWENLIF